MFCICIQEPNSISNKPTPSPIPTQQCSSIEEQKSNAINLQTNKTHPKPRKKHKHNFRHPQFLMMYNGFVFCHLLSHIHCLLRFTPFIFFHPPIKLSSPFQRHRPSIPVPSLCDTGESQDPRVFCCILATDNEKAAPPPSQGLYV
jgi:hypothetical protein